MLAGDCSFRKAARATGSAPTAHVEEGGELLLIEMIAPGRTASGEVFAFAELDWETEVFLGATRRSRASVTRCRRKARRSRRCGRVFPRRITRVVSSSRRSCARTRRAGARIHDLHSDEAWVGCSALVRGGWAIRVLAAGSIALRKTIAADAAGTLRRARPAGTGAAAHLNVEPRADERGDIAQPGAGQAGDAGAGEKLRDGLFAEAIGSHIARRMTRPWRAARPRRSRRRASGRRATVREGQRQRKGRGDQPDADEERGVGDRSAKLAMMRGDADAEPAADDDGLELFRAGRSA